MGYEIGTFYFGVKSKLVRATLCHDLKTLVDELILRRDIALIEGFRSDERQNQLFNEGKTKVRAGESNHNHTDDMGQPDSEAVDMVPWPFSKKDWGDRDKFHLFAGYVLAVADELFIEGKMTRRVRWGGDWDHDWEASDNEFDDFPHFEMFDVGVWRNG